jgi:hypothetical protein
VHDQDEPARIIAELMGSLAPGSYLAVTHARADGEQGMRDAAGVYREDRSPNPMRLRSQDEVRALFGRLTLVEPGVVLLPCWRPDLVDDRAGGSEVSDDYPGFAALGRRD